MGGAVPSVSHGAQWLGLIATLAGTVLGGLSFAFAMIAAWRAKGAREQARLAKEAAIRLGRIAQLGDLIADMQELQTMLARNDFPGIAGKGNLLRGRIVRFKAEAYPELTESEKQNLDLARGQLEVIVRVAAIGKARPERRQGDIQLGYGKAHEALNHVVAMHGAHAQGDDS